jgi:glucose-6-phosphate 1-epimerase
MSADLEERFGISERIQIVNGPTDAPHVLLRTGQAEAVCSLYGGQVLRYGYDEQPQIVWLGQEAQFVAGKAIRAGIPICWPWFGPHPYNSQKPAHGFARLQLWELLESGADSESAWIKMGLRDNEETRQIWPISFELSLLVRLGERLELSLTSTNTGDRAFQLSSALHSYFAVGAIEEIAIDGLDGVGYYDQLSRTNQRQVGPIRFHEELDRIYQNTNATCSIIDPVWKRKIFVAKQGSRSTVVWNPWIEKAKRFSDFGDEDYRGMVCIETANAGSDQIDLKPQASHTLGTTIWAEPEG